MLILLCRFLTLFAALMLAASILIVCSDVILRALDHPFQGGYDLVRITGTLTIVCALPLTTAVKGHVAIEYFFRKLNRVGRICVDSLMRLIMILAFSLTAWECIHYGHRLLKTQQVSDTIEIPLFWVPWVMAFAFGLTALIVCFHLLHPGKEMLRP